MNKYSPLYCISSSSLEYFAKHDVHHSFEQNLGIEPPGSVFQVVEVKTQSSQHLRHCIRISVIQGGIRSSTRSDLIQISISRVMLDDLVDVVFPFRAGTDQRHVSL